MGIFIIMISKQALIERFVSNRELQTMEQVDELDKAVDQYLLNFDYQDLDIYLCGFFDNAEIEGPMTELQLNFFETLLPKNPMRYIEALLTKYKVMLPHAESWFSMLFGLLLVGDDQVGWIPLKRVFEDGIGTNDGYLKELIANRIKRLTINLSGNNNQFRDTNQVILDRLRYLQDLLAK